MNEVNFYHGKSKDGHRFTLARSSVKTKDNLIKSVASIAVCSEKDTFKKSFGRRVAEARLRKGDKVTTFTFPTNRELFEYVNSQLVSDLTQLFSLNKSK